MTPTSLVIVTDRGSLKAYRVTETPTRGPSLQLVQAFNITDAHGRLVDKLSDVAGRFPVTEGAGAHRGAASIAEPRGRARTVDLRPLPNERNSLAKSIGEFKRSWPIKSRKLFCKTEKKAGRLPLLRKYTRQSWIPYLLLCGNESSNM